MIVADKSVSTWPWLRREIDHPFRVDRRNPIVGFINRDEAAVLYANARLFAGRKGIEIGAWRGWSTAHLIASGLGSLHVVEPLLADPVWRAEIEEVARAAGGGETTILVPEASPAAVERLGQSGVRWSFAFIDGDHDGEAPTRDALALAPYLEPTAMVLFHDLVSPHVAKGLARARGDGLERHRLSDRPDGRSGVAGRGRAGRAQAGSVAGLAGPGPSEGNCRFRARTRAGVPNRERTMSRAIDAKGLRRACDRALLLSPPATADEAQIARGRYLVGIAGCSDCHTPGGMLGVPRHEPLPRRIGRRLFDSRPRASSSGRT